MLKRFGALLIMCAIISTFVGCNCKHEWIDATCIAPKTCSVCEETEGDALGHTWNDATCTNPKYCNVCGETDGDPSEHIKSEWILTEEPTFADVGVEEITCTVCGNVLDSREIAKKKPEVIGNTFNFTDKELIDWANSWLNGTYRIEYYGHFDLGSDILGYKVKTDDGEEGMLLLKHDGGDEVSAIMVYFENFVDRSVLALFFGTKINTDFIYDDAALVLANNSTYFAGNMIATNLTIEDDMEITLLTPETYMYKIVAGTSLTPSDCYVTIAQNGERFAEYNNNVWEYIKNEYGENNSCWFWHDDIDIETEDSLGEVTTFRGIVLAESTEKDVITAYGQADMELQFDKNTDILYRSMKAANESDYKYLDDTKKVLVYDYHNLFQIAFYIDNEGIMDFILYTDGVWYEN